MKKTWLLVVALLFVGAVGLSWAGVVENWVNLDTSQTGAYADSSGSVLSFSAVKGEKKAMTLQLTYDLKAGGYCGVYHNMPGLDLSKAGAFMFKAKTTVAGEVQMAVKDKWNVQYTAKFNLSGKAWEDVKVPVASFAKDPYYTPDDAVLGHPLDLSKLNGMNFSPQAPGKGVLTIGEVTFEEGPSGSAPAATEAAAPAATLASEQVVICDFNTPAESGTNGVYQDSQGSAFAFVLKPVSKKKKEQANQCAEVTYNLAQGGYCGMWHRAGDSWDGVNIAGAGNITFMLKSKTPVQIGVALKDKNNNQYVADADETVSEKEWVKVTIPVSRFILDPYYTPEGAVKGAPMDLSKLQNFNLQPKTPGKGLFYIDDLQAER